MNEPQNTELEDRLRTDTYRDDPEVHFGLAEARKNPEEWLGVPERLASRLTTLGEAYELHHLPMIDIYDDTVFSSQQCESLHHELRFLDQILSDPALAEVIASLTALVKTAAERSLRLVVSGN